MSKLIYEELSNTVLGLALAVHREFGPGLLESAYEGAYAVELTRACLPFERQKVYPLIYKSEYVSSYIADLVVDNKVLIEVKSVSSLTRLMEAQVINYLKLSKIRVGYLVNFNSVMLCWKRLVV